MFWINGQKWKIEFVESKSNCLKNSLGYYTVGVTDNNTKCVYLSNQLRGTFLRRVIAHELCHCFCFSYDIHMSLDEEERLADWVSLYGSELIYLLDDLLRVILTEVA